MIDPQQFIHLLRRILIVAVLVMYQKVVHFLDLPGCLLAEAAYRSSQCKDPNGGTDRHMVILRQIDTDLLWAGAFGCLLAALNFRDSKNDGG